MSIKEIVFKAIDAGKQHEYGGYIESKENWFKQNIKLKSFEQLQKEWVESTCGRTIEKFIYDELTK